MADISESSAESAKATPQEHAESRKDLVRALVLCVLAVIFVRSFLFEPFKIPSSSMVPTLKIGDHIFVSKFNYGLSLPFTKIEFAKWSQPERGDIIVFLFPRDESLHYIKRVVGVPGDEISFKGKDLYVNGELVQKELVATEAEVENVLGLGQKPGMLYKEKLGDALHYVKYSNTNSYEISGLDKIETVPPDKFFVMGDNRDDSYDSRSWGFVPRENIKGRAQMIWLSLDQEEAWGADKIRWSRVGTLIH